MVTSCWKPAWMKLFISMSQHTDRFRANCWRIDTMNGRCFRSKRVCNKWPDYTLILLQLTLLHLRSCQMTKSLDMVTVMTLGNMCHVWVVVSKETVTELQLVLKALSGMHPVLMYLAMTLRIILDLFYVLHWGCWRWPEIATRVFNCDVCVTR